MIYTEELHTLAANFQVLNIKRYVHTYSFSSCVVGCSILDGQASCAAPISVVSKFLFPNILILLLIFNFVKVKSIILWMEG